MIPRELFRKIRRLEIRTKGRVDALFGGEYHSAFKGRGIEFAEVRPYQIGDDVRTIDWNVSARTGETYVKVFEEEREQTLLLLVDVSASGDFGSGARPKREVAAEASALLAFSAIRNNDKVGLLLFSDRVERFIRPAKGRRHVLRLIRELFTHTPSAPGTDIAEALRFARRVLRRRAVVLVISDFYDAGYEKLLRALAARHDAVALQLRDPREAALPDVGLLTLTDAETGERRLVDTSSPHVRRAFAKRARRQQAATAETLRRARTDHVLLPTEADVAEPLVRFFRHRNQRA